MKKIVKFVCVIKIMVLPIYLLAGALTCLLIRDSCKKVEETVE